MHKNAISLALLGVAGTLATSADALEIRFSDLDNKHRVIERIVGSDEELAASAERALQDASYRHRPDLDFADTWVAEIGTLLTHDLDGDGYFTGFSLSVDVDTYRTDEDIYLALYTRNRSGTVSPLHVTRDFSIYGDALYDEYEIDIDLLTRYPADAYDLIIDVHDARSDRILDTVDDRIFSNLSRLPLESEDLDIAPNPPINRPGVPVNDDGPASIGSIRVEEHAGSGSVWWLAGLLILAARARRGSHPRV